MLSFTATILKIGINPYMRPPAVVLKELFAAAGKSRGPIPIRGTFHGFDFVQTLVKYRGQWRLYLNAPMRKASGMDVGDVATIHFEFDPADRTLAMNPALGKALLGNKKALQVFEQLPPGRQKEIIRYIGHLKSEEAVKRNIDRAIKFLLGKTRFIGRDKPLDEVKKK